MINLSSAELAQKLVKVKTILICLDTVACPSSLVVIEHWEAMQDSGH